MTAMVKKGILALAVVMVLGLCWYRFYWSSVSLALAEPYNSELAGEDAASFWISDRHSNAFQVGNIYTLQSGKQQVQLRLLSIAVGSARPGELRLGFHPTQNELVELEMGHYRLVEQKTSAKPY